MLGPRQGPLSPYRALLPPPHIEWSRQPWGLQGIDQEGDICSVISPISGDLRTVNPSISSVLRCTGGPWRWESCCLVGEPGTLVLARYRGCVGGEALARRTVWQ
jgi:hypothetical protein